MYENPQYLTPEGYRRSKIQSLRKKLRESKLKKSHPPESCSPGPAPVVSTRRIKRRTVSKEAAKLIAETISIMLKDK